MAKSLDKKKHGSSLFEYGENPAVLYESSAIRNNLMNHNISKVKRQDYERSGSEERVINVY